MESHSSYRIRPGLRRQSALVPRLLGSAVAGFQRLGADRQAFGGIEHRMYLTVR
jgi:hypothetical protein